MEIAKNNLSMSRQENIFVEWFLWHFYEMPKFLLQVWQNYFMFATNYFSVILLLKTFFSPWRRYRWRYPKGFDLGEFLSVFISNSFSRILGSMMRVVLIIVGICFQIFVLTAGIIVLLLWLLLPFIIIAGFLIFLFY